MATDRLRSLSLISAMAAGLALGSVPGCQDQRESSEEKRGTQCSSCHGDPARGGSALVRAAPPTDTLGNTGVNYSGVGAHQYHLTATKTHSAVACNECHKVPEQTGDEGHADTPRPAELMFGDLARQGGRNPSYADSRCSDTYCHRGSEMVWTAPRDSDAACGSCHGLPPPAPHPQNAKCHTCHGDVIAEGNVFVDTAKHVDGTVQRGQSTCDSCHGSDGEAAPPQDLQGNTAVTALGVGAHRIHLAGGANSRPVKCAECHVVPTSEGDKGHRDSDSPAEVIFTGVATSDGRLPAWDRNVRRCNDAWCHSPSAPGPSAEWTSDAGRLPCTGCHGAPPAPPHPQMTDCSRCHGAVVADDDKSIKDKSRHVDGIVDVVVLTGCTDCHGSSTSPAPPTDVSGSSATTSPGVGAHQAHLVGKGNARKVACIECHAIPAAWNTPGHTDTAAPAELTFSGVAVTGGATPSYTGGSCQQTYCHGGAFPKGNSGGAVTAPVWTKVDGTQAACGGCHGLPPAPPHAKVGPTSCALCHKNVDATLNFLFPETHVDGKVTGDVP